MNCIAFCQKQRLIQCYQDAFFAQTLHDLLPVQGIASFFLSPQSANPQPNFNFLNPQPQLRNWTFKSLVRNRKSTYGRFRILESATASPQLRNI